MKLVVRKIPVTMIDHAETGKAARSGRKADGFSLRSVAKEMGFSPPYISDLENGRRQWSDKLLNGYLRALASLKIKALQAAMKKPMPNLRIGSR